MLSSRRIFLLLTTLFVAAHLAAAELPAYLSQMIASSCVSADFNYVAEGRTKVSGEGRITVQDSCYVLDLNLMQVYCDGARRWTVDPVGKEVCIEKAPGSVKGEIAGYLVESFHKLPSGGLKTTVTSGGGTRIRLDVPALKESSKQPVSLFRFDTSLLDGSWVITDLTE